MALPCDEDDERQCKSQTISYNHNILSLINLNEQISHVNVSSKPCKPKLEPLDEEPKLLGFIKKVWTSKNDSASKSRNKRELISGTFIQSRICPVNDENQDQNEKYEIEYKPVWSRKIKKSKPLTRKRKIYNPANLTPTQFVQKLHEKLYGTNPKMSITRVKSETELFPNCMENKAFKIYVQACLAEHKKHHPDIEVPKAEFINIAKSKWLELSEKRKDIFFQKIRKTRSTGEMVAQRPSPYREIDYKKYEEDWIGQVWNDLDSKSSHSKLNETPPRTMTTEQRHYTASTTTSTEVDKNHYTKSSFATSHRYLRMIEKIISNKKDRVAKEMNIHNITDTFETDKVVGWNPTERNWRRKVPNTFQSTRKPAQSYYEINRSISLTLAAKECNTINSLYTRTMQNSDFEVNKSIDIVVESFNIMASSKKYTANSNSNSSATNIFIERSSLCNAAKRLKPSDALFRVNQIVCKEETGETTKKKRAGQSTYQMIYSLVENVIDSSVSALSLSDTLEFETVECQTRKVIYQILHSLVRNVINSTSKLSPDDMKSEKILHSHQKCLNIEESSKPGSSEDFKRHSNKGMNNSTANTVISYINCKAIDCLVEGGVKCESPDSIEGNVIVCNIGKKRKDNEDNENLAKKKKYDILPGSLGHEKIERNLAPRARRCKSQTISYNHNILSLINLNEQSSYMNVSPKPCRPKFEPLKEPKRTGFFKDVLTSKNISTSLGRNTSKITSIEYIEPRAAKNEYQEPNIKSEITYQPFSSCKSVKSIRPTLRKCKSETIVKKHNTCLFIVSNEKTNSTKQVIEACKPNLGYQKTNLSSSKDSRIVNENEMKHETNDSMKIDVTECNRESKVIVDKATEENVDPNKIFDTKHDSFLQEKNVERSGLGLPVRRSKSKTISYNSHVLSLINMNQQMISNRSATKPIKPIFGIPKEGSEHITLEKNKDNISLKGEIKSNKIIPKFTAKLIRKKT